ncbi:MAG: conserved membrane protein of unknown function [Promethearchaeota archaeon]|nr:MAG: conserved membrane protein of unknown function [Candidatus Lokiarchaeota archaeon]
MGFVKENIDRIFKISIISGFLTVILYISFTLLSWALFPNPATPFNHWLSDLGRFQVPADGSPVWDPETLELFSGPSQYNPGAIWYNLGCIFTGISLFPFFLGFLKLKEEESKMNRRLISGTISVGFASAFALIMIGIFFEDWGDIHHFWTILFFILMLIVKILAGIITWRLDFKKAVPIYAWIIIIFDLIVIFTNNSFAIIEWISVFTGLALVGIIAYNFRTIE